MNQYIQINEFQDLSLIAMPQRIVAHQLAQLLGVLAHPQRIRLLEELRDRELHVAELQQRLDLSQSGVSQHLSVLRAHRLVAERRAGRHVHYRLRHPRLAGWLAEAMAFLEDDQGAADEVRRAIAKVRRLWGPAGSARKRRRAPPLG